MGSLVWGLYRLTKVKELPETPQGEQQETDEGSAFPKPLPFCVSGSLVMGGDGWKSE
jgi:hypothetical protein